MRRTHVAAVLASLLLLALLPMVAQARKADPGSGPGCDASRPAVAHFAGGAPLLRQRKDPPVPCGVSDGLPGGESRLAVTNAGTVLYYPAQLPITNATGSDTYIPQFLANPAANVAVARSVDVGATWKGIPWPQALNLPLPADWPLYNFNDSQMYVDRASGVILTALFDFENHGDNNPIMRSTDDGKTWTAVVACCGWAENPEFTSAPPPPGGEQPAAGYPSVIYFCHNVEGTLGIPPVRTCNKSVDGGASWGIAQSVVHPSVPPRPECANGVDSTGYPQGTPDGSLYLTVTCGSSTFLGRSTDEAATWPIVRTLPHGGQLRADGVGNLYLARTTTSTEGTKLLLSHSTDRGATWSPELDVLAPGVHKLGTWDVAAAGTGEVAFNYFAVRPDNHLDGYITQTRSALDGSPLFYSGMVNKPSQPLADHASLGLGFDFVSVDIGRDGTAWGSFVRQCQTPSFDAVCENPTVNPSTGGFGQPYVGFIGHLAGV